MDPEGVARPDDKEKQPGIRGLSVLLRLQEV